VLDSSAGFSEQIKAQVGEQLKLGKSEQEILDFFVERYGPWILREPPTQGFNLLAWALPIGLLILGPFAIWYTVWRKRVDVSSYGVRRVELIVDQMDAELSALRERQR
jgi:cytochrome c-type biogenesis protein CcmH